MLAQRLRHLITIESKATSINAYRENVGAWSTLRQVYAGVEPVSGREFMASSGSQAELQTRFICRHEDVSDVTPQMRITFDGKVYDITEVINERTVNRMVSLIGKAGTNAGGQ